MKVSPLVLILLILIPGLTAFGADPAILDIGAALKMGRENNLSMKSALVDMAVLRRNRKASWNSLLPGLSLRTGMSYSLPSLTESPIRGSVGASGSMVFSSVTAYDKRRTDLAYEAGLITLKDLENQLDRDIKKDFYSLILLEEKIKIIDDHIKTAKKKYENALQSYDRGLVPELTVLQAQVALENLLPDLEESRQDYDISMINFKALLGVDLTAEIALEGAIMENVVPAGNEESVSGYVQNRWNVQSVMNQIRELENQIRYQKTAGYYPDLTLSYSYTGRISRDSQDGEAGAIGYTSLVSLGATVSLPVKGLFPSSPTRIKLKNLEDSIVLKNYELEGKIRDAEVVIISLFKELEKSRKVLEARRSNVALAERVYSLTEKGYEAGFSGSIQVDEAYDDLLQAKLNLLLEVYNYQAVVIDLDYEMNILDGGQGE